MLNELQIGGLRGDLLQMIEPRKILADVILPEKTRRANTEHFYPNREAPANLRNLGVGRTSRHGHGTGFQIYRTSGNRENHLC